MRGRAVLAAVMALWAGATLAEGLDEAVIVPDQRTAVERLLARAGFGALRKSYALVVGVSEFADYEALPTGNDPLRMRDYLIDEAEFDHVHVLTEDKVTKARLEELILDEFRPLIGPADRFLFYWSGHGETIALAEGSAGFLPLSDSRKTALSTMVAMSDLARWNRFIAAHQVLFLLDSCFSGLAGSAAQSGLAEITRQQLSGPGRHMITAGRVNEQTIAVDDLGGSIFTHALLKGLRGAADSRNELGADGLVSVGELKNYLGQEIGRLRQVYNWQKTITPQIRDLSGSDGAFFFPVPASYPPPPPPSPPLPPPPPETEVEVVPKGGGAEVAEAVAGGIVLPMVRISGGAFMMGRDDGSPAEGPRREVGVAPFWIAQTETTEALFNEYVVAEGLDFINRKVEEDPTCYEWDAKSRLRRTAFAYNQLLDTPEDAPVSCVNRADIDGFLVWLNDRTEGPPFRLPSEAEFEFLLSSSGMTGVTALDRGVCGTANVADTSSPFRWRNAACDDGFPGVAPVAQFAPDGFGLYDLRGNLWEWVADCWRPSHDAAVPAGPCDTGTVRGASFDDPLANLRSTVRQPVPVKRRQTNIGFRLARDAE